MSRTKYIRWMKRVLIGTSIMIISCNMTVLASGTSSQSLLSEENYQKISEILDAPSMKTGIPQKLGADAVTYVENNSVVDTQDLTYASNVIYRDATGNIIGQVAAADAGEYEKQLVKVSQIDSIKNQSSDSQKSNAGTSTATGTVYMEDDQEKKGPQVEEVTLDETYHSDYEIYSESVAGYFFFYTNVANNGMTDQAVSVDLPVNITYSVQKDGVDIAYTSKQKLSETGTYVFKISVVKNPEDPVSEQVVYKTTYNFRIQPKPIGNSTDGEGVTVDDSYYTSDYYADIPGEEITLPEEMTETMETQVVEEEPETVVISEEPETIDGLRYDRSTGHYQKYYQDNYYLESSVPDGMITDQAVYIGIEGLGTVQDNVTVDKDGTDYGISSDGYYSEQGSYTVQIPLDEEIYEYQFVVVSPDGNSLESYTIPYSLTLEELYYEGEVQDIQQYEGESGITVTFDQDGSYRLALKDNFQNTYETTVLIDTTPPECSISKTDTGVSVIYDADDVAQIVLSNGSTEQVYETLTEITAKGKYTLYLYDAAGNVSVTEFKVGQGLNTAGFVFIFMMIGLAAGIVIFYRKTKKNVNIK